MAVYASPAGARVCLKSHFIHPRLSKTAGDEAWTDCDSCRCGLEPPFLAFLNFGN